MPDDDLGPGLRRGGMKATGLACARGERVLFTDLDLVLDPGDIVWLRAANGHGKTSLLRVLAGLARPASGRVERGAPTLYLAHTNALKDDLTVAESLAFHARLFGLDADEARRRDAIARFGLATRSDAPTRTLSQGQRRRAALARLCLSPPDAVWLLDEPFDALDADATARVGSLVAAHADAGGAVLMTSHTPPPLPATRMRTLALDATDVG